MDYEFSLQWSENYKKYKEEKIRSVVDLAITWGLLKEEQFEVTLKALQKLLKDKRKFTISASLKMDVGVFDSIIDNIAALTEDKIHLTAAESVLYADYYGRRTPTQRAAAFQGFFAAYAKSKPRSDGDFTALIDALAKFLGANSLTRELAAFEDETSKDYNYTTTRRMLEHNSILDEFTSFKSAITLLTNNVKSFKSIVEGERLLPKLKAIRLQPEINVRFLGRLVSELAAADSLDSKVERVMTVDYTEDGEDQKLIIAR
jgi:hypothetical protein